MSPSLEVKKTKNKGRGVFALANFRKGDLAEACPVIAVFRENEEIPDKLESFPYEWTKNKCAIVGGNACFYNHSFKPNVEVDINTRKKF